MIMKIPGIVLMLLCCSFLATSQVERKPSPSTQSDSTGNDTNRNRLNRNRKKDLIKDLDLSREQKIKLKELRQSNMAKKETIENNLQLNDQDKKRQLHSLQKEQAQNIQAILTDEQKAKFKKNKQAIKEGNN